MQFNNDDNVRYFDQDEQAWFHGFVTNYMDDGFYEVWEDESKSFMYIHKDNLELDRRKDNLDLL